MHPNIQIFVLCAGEGKRLRPHTEHQPKCMVPYKGKPLLQHQLDVFKRCGLTDITLIGGYRHDALPPKYPIVFNERYAQTNMLYSLFCAEKSMKPDSDWIISYGDIIYHPSVLQKLLASQDPISIITDVDWERYWANRMEDPLDDAETFRWDSVSRCISELGKKPKTRDEIQGQYIGLFKISAAYTRTFKIMYHKFCTTRNNNSEQAYMTDFLQFLIDQQQPVFGVPIHNHWQEFDTAADLQTEVDFL